ncbi:MAG: hypothetical protein HQL88_00555 [Magnetococcales bacterium]|nr:hypothetical protein [Magnetococcales bacterium]
MPVLILIDGLDSTPAAPDSMPVWRRLAATGRTGRLHCAAAPLFDLFGHGVPAGDGGQADLPLGYASALALADQAGSEWPDPERIWCCLGFTHLYKKQNDLLFLSPERTGQSEAECRALLEAILPDWQEAGWLLYPPTQIHKPENSPPARWGPAGGRYFVLSRDASLPPPAVVRSQPLDTLEGDSFRTRSPSGAYAATLLPLLTVGQLILVRHPVNQRRQQAGRVSLNTPWMWGVGSGMGGMPVRHAEVGCCWTAQPVVAGLARAKGYRLAWLDEEKDFTPLVAEICQAMTTGVVLLHLSLPAVLARHGLLEERHALLQRINDQLLEPLAQTAEQLLIADLDAVSTTEKTIPWVMARGRSLVRKRRFWHRGQPGVGPVLNPAQFWSLCGLS